MLDTLKKWGGAVLAFLFTAALAVSYAMRRRASDAESKLARAREQDALEKGQEESSRVRLLEIDAELKRPEIVSTKRTVAQILEEQRRRGQLQE